MPINASATPQTFRYGTDQPARAFGGSGQTQTTDRSGRVNPNSVNSLTPLWRQQFRNAFDSEVWDDLANVVFSAAYADQPGVVAGTTVTVGTLTIPCPVACRAHITFRSTEAVPANAQGIQRVLVDGVEIPNTATQFQSASATTITMTYTADADLAAGSHLLTFRAQAVTSNVDFLVNIVSVRRGRVPSA